MNTGSSLNMLVGKYVMKGYYKADITLLDVSGIVWWHF